MANPAEDNAKRVVEEGAAAKEKMVADAEERQGAQPTPTQEENDLAKSGQNVMEKEDDGSGPERRPGESKEDAKKRADATSSKTKESKPASPPTGYNTRDQQSTGRQQTPQSRSGSTENK